MKRWVFRAGGALASAAALGLTAAPALARDPWGGGWGGGWGRHHDRVDAGDVIAGILIIGGIAAVASAASKASKNRRDDRRYPDDRDYRDNPDNHNDDYRGEPGRLDYGAGYSGEMNDAVNRCIDEVNRGSSRVESIDGAERDGRGWRVRGRVNGNSPFTCSLDGDGRIREVSIDGHAA